MLLAEHFPYRDDDLTRLAFRFNRVVSNRYYEILDFINMHYCLTRRTDTPFWQEVQKPERITDRLKAKFEYWKTKPPSAADCDDQSFPGGAGQMQRVITGCDPRSPVDAGGLWNHESYEAIMYGMHFCGEPLKPPPDGAPKPRVMPTIIHRLQAAKQKLPPHDLWLQKVLGATPIKSSGYEPAGWASETSRPF